MLPSPVRAQKSARPRLLSCAPNCQVSHSSETITNGRPNRLTILRTSRVIDPASRSVSTEPHNKVVITVPPVPSSGKPRDSRPIAAVPSRMTTSSKVVQPINCTIFRMTGRRAKWLPKVAAINPALDRPLSQPSLAVHASKPEPTMEPSRMAIIASRLPTDGTRYAPIWMTRRPTPRLNQSEACSCQ